MNTFDISTLVRPAILQMKPYSSAREEFTGQEAVFLDANESPYNKPLNRYPDPFQQQLRARLAELKGVKPANIILGNGSDETIDMLFRCFCEPGKDQVLSVSPTYGMYKVSADIHGVGYVSIPLQADYSLPVQALLERTDARTKLLFLCSPNNPTGNRFCEEDLKALLESFPGLVVLDEAYVDFSESGSLLEVLDVYPRLVVLQTLSKAWGLAALRLGMAFASPAIITLLQKVKPPYNINALTQEKALKALADPSRVQQQVEEIRLERKQLMKGLAALSMVKAVKPSDANFFLIQVEDPLAVYQYLAGHGIIVRDRSREPLCEGCLRITVGSPAQNRYLLVALQQYGGAMPFRPDPQDTRQVMDALNLPDRTVRKERNTSETRIRIALGLDGKGNAQIATGLGFFDHMLHQIARHSGCDLQIEVQGDLEVDEHHSMEDTALALGEAFAEALGDKLGLERYGFALPMDECAALVLIDFGGRPELVWKARFKREKIGDLPTEMFEHFFKSFAIGARCNVYIKAKGQNEHHKIEAIFKAFARALRMAVRREVWTDVLPSTKGLL